MAREGVSETTVIPFRQGCSYQVDRVLMPTRDPSAFRSVLIDPPLLHQQKTRYPTFSEAVHARIVRTTDYKKIASLGTGPLAHNGHPHSALGDTWFFGVHTMESTTIPYIWEPSFAFRRHTDPRYRLFTSQQCHLHRRSEYRLIVAALSPTFMLRFLERKTLS
jgi:hypothetical protein